jgi:hypothetical protein
MVIKGFHEPRYDKLKRLLESLPTDLEIKILKTEVSKFTGIPYGINTYIQLGQAWGWLIPNGADKFINKLSKNRL